MQEMHNPQLSIVQHVTYGLRFQQEWNLPVLQCYEQPFFVSLRTM